MQDCHSVWDAPYSPLSLTLTALLIKQSYESFNGTIFKLMACLLFVITGKATVSSSASSLSRRVQRAAKELFIPKKDLLHIKYYRWYLLRYEASNSREIL